MNNIRYYEIEAEQVDIFGNLREICFTDNILRNISKTTKSLIDIACGDGYTIYTATKSKKHFIREAYGLDISIKRLQKTKKFVPQSALIQGSILNLPFKSDSFDTVICSETIEHIRNYQTALLELVRITKKELIITVPNEEKLILERCPQCNTIFPANDHVNSFNAKDMKKTIELQNTNIKIKKILKFHTIYSYNNFTIKWPSNLRVTLDRIFVLLSNKIPFFINFYQKEARIIF